ncbi:hypothetical protein NQZ68_000887 [Dissostichus eleginoides]|nr:hypothetical protein NQZ68_000887 [Dissostichus eleginoides]
MGAFPLRVEDEGSVAEVSEEAEAEAEATALCIPPAPTLASTPVAVTASATTLRSGKTKRSLFQENSNVLRDMMAADERNHEKMLTQRARHLQLLLEDTREARQREREVRQEEQEARQRERQEDAAAAVAAAATATAFNQGFLGVLGQLVQAIAGRNAAQPPQ